ncbi:ABC transporter permease [Paeniglutamicibacter sp. ABSL32-1]|uniref:ABC transporter permease n=1 Tax=Paeniglutamicibacter quisquiliarum TaxID=2849498 RepID=UPI001C2D26CC|nr:ABC transporter permease [Paeniglutamicibacter quisquiliarum]MBV1781048.1 ABC transporter permease [Paeniglutamicibacter quisquiliarum]
MVFLVAALVILPIIFTTMNAQYLSPGNLDSMMRQASVLLLVVAAGTAPILMGSIDLSVGAIVSLCAVAAALFAQSMGQSAVFWVLPLGLLIGLFNGVIVSYIKLPSFLVTLGTSFVFGGIALLASGGFPVQLVSGSLNAAFHQSLFGIFPMPLVYAVILWLLLIVWLRRTATGRFIYAIGGNERAAKVCGVNVRWVKSLAFGAGGLCCGLAGVLVLFSTTAATPDIGNSFLLPSIAAIVMGGTPLSGGQGGAARGLIGTLILVELTNGMLIIGLPPAAQQIVQGIVVILAVLLTFDRRTAAVVK